jgi:hypothetical protein
VFKITNISIPSSVADAVTKRYVDMIHRHPWAPIHDERFAEIEQIMGEVGIKFIQVTAYANEYMPSGAVPMTAQCTTKTHVFLINMNPTKQFQIQTEIIADMYMLNGPSSWFDMHDRDFFVKLARYLRKERALPLLKYWFVRLKLWWNK